MTITSVLENQIFRRATQGIASLASRVIPDDSHLLLFGSNAGQYYSDNSRYLYEWVLENEPELSPVWITKSEVVLQRLRAADMPVEQANSLSGLKSLYQADTGFFTHSMADIAPDPLFVPPSLRLVYLRHGEPVKNTHLGPKNRMLVTKAKQRQSEEWQTRNIRVIATSSFIAETQRRRLGVSESQQLVTGYPRHDPLWDDPNQTSAKSILDNHVDIDLDGINQTILYAPTWRQYEPLMDDDIHTEFFPFDSFSVGELSELLENLETMVLLRPHPHDLQKSDVKDNLRALEDACDFVQVTGPDTLNDVYDIIPAIDVLITDYSSLYHDFLILDLPIVLIPYDYPLYEEHVGFIYDYKKHAPGPLIESWDEFRTHVTEISNGSDGYAQQRTALRNMLYKYHDGGASSRIVKTLNRNQ